MNTEERIKKQKELVEQIGRHFDKEGFQPIAGRILGLLMVMDKEQYTFDEIVEELKISKSSASNALRNLEIRGHIEYITLPGDRKRYFRMKTQDSFDLFEDFKTKTTNMKNFLNKIIELKADKNSLNCQTFNTLIEMFDFILKNLEDLKQRFNK